MRLYSGPAYQPINDYLRQVGRLSGRMRLKLGHHIGATFAATVAHLSRAVRKLVSRGASAGVRDADGDARAEQRGPPIEGADPRTFRGGANARDVVCHLRALLDDAEAALASS